MLATEALQAVAGHAGLSGRALSKALGKAETWARNSYGRDTKLGTLADAADVAGCEVRVVDRETGDTVAVIDPPSRS